MFPGMVRSWDFPPWFDVITMHMPSTNRSIWTLWKPEWRTPLEGMTWRKRNSDRGQRRRTAGWQPAMEPSCWWSSCRRAPSSPRSHCRTACRPGRGQQSRTSWWPPWLCYARSCSLDCGQSPLPWSGVTNSADCLVNALSQITTTTSNPRTEHTLKSPHSKQAFSSHSREYLSSWKA